MNNEEKTTELTNLWYRIVSLDHHKDRDCHWYINKVWSYGQKPYYRVEHYGYIYDEESLTTQNEHYPLLELAEIALIEALEDAIKTEEEWAKDVLENINDYDDIQIYKAREIKRLGG